MNMLPFETQCRVIAALTEVCGVRATARLVGVDKHTVISLGLRVGDTCANLHDTTMRNFKR